MSAIIRPTGIIRTLPYFGASYKGEVRDSSKREAMNKAYLRMMRAIKSIEKGNAEHVLIALAQKPRIEVLHLYLLIGGEIRVRGNIAGYQEGDQVGALHCWDDSIRSAKFWAIMTAPVSWPPEPIKRKGFQGIRYTADLW